jgi:hypothetical protein
MALGTLITLGLLIYCPNLVITLLEPIYSFRFKVVISPSHRHLLYSPLLVVSRIHPTIYFVFQTS